MDARKIISISLLFLTPLASVNTYAINKCTGSDGKITFSDVACSKNSSSARIIKERQNTLDSSDAQDFSSGSTSDRTLPKTNNSSSCLIFSNQVKQTYQAFLANAYPARWDVALQSLQTFASSCPSANTCKLINDRVSDAQARYSEKSSPVRGAQLNGVTALMCR